MKDLKEKYQQMGKESKLNRDVWIMCLDGVTLKASLSLGEIWEERNELIRLGHLSAEIEIFKVTKAVMVF